MKTTLFTRFILIAFASLLLPICSVAQNVGINSTGAAPNASAMLDVTSGSGTLGLLIPRMTQATRTGITTLPAAAQGLVVYQTDGLQGFYYNISTTTTPSWVYLNPDAWSLTGNSGTTPGTDFIGTTDAKDFVVKTNNTERMRVTSGGTIDLNVGRGNVYLENNSNDNTDGAGITLRTSSNPTNGSMFAVRSSGQAVRLWVGQSVTSSGQNNFYVGTTSDGHSSPAIQLKTSGDGIFGGSVAVGSSSSPSYPLDVTGSIRSTALAGTGTRMVQADANGALTPMAAGTSSQVLLGTGVWGTAPAWGLTGNSGTTAGTNFIGTTDATDLVIKTNNSERIRVTSTGDVGIGTSTPSFPLDVVSSGSSWPLKIQNTSGYIEFGPANASWAHIYTDRPAFIFNQPIYSIGNAFSSYSTGDLSLQTGGTARITALSSNGYVGIGTASPSYRLEAAGDIYANGGWLRVSGNRGLYFQSHGGGWYMTDNSWIRTYGNKNVYQNTGILRTDGTLQVGSGGSTFDAVNGGSVTAASGKFEVNSSGNLVKVNNVSYSWPASQAGAANDVLTNDGSGNLSWAPAAGLSGAVTKASSLGASSNSTNSLYTKVSLTVSAGTYIIFFSCQLMNDTYDYAGSYYKFTDGSTTFADGWGGTSGAGGYCCQSYVGYATYTGSKTLYIQYKNYYNNNGSIAYIKNARITALKIQ